MVYTYNGILFIIKRKKIFIYAITWMNPEKTVFSKISQKQTNIV